jgi:hypothetical protein
MLGVVKLSVVLLIVVVPAKNVPQTMFALAKSIALSLVAKSSGSN